MSRNPVFLLGHLGKCSGFCFVLLRDWYPGLVRIKDLHGLEFCERFRPEIFLIDDAVIANGERLHSRYSVLSWCSHQGEAPDHHAFNDEIHLTEWRRGSLPFQNFEKIAVVWL